MEENSNEVIFPSDTSVSIETALDTASLGSPKILSQDCIEPALIAYQDIDTIGAGECPNFSFTREWTVSICGQLIVHQQKIDVGANFQYTLFFPKDDTIGRGANNNLGSIPQVRVIEDGNSSITVSYEDEVFFATQDPDACYKILRTYRVINWCEYNGESQPVVVSREWDTWNGTDCSEHYNINPTDPGGNGTPGDRDIFVNVRKDLTDNLPDTVYYDNDADPSTNNNSVDDPATPGVIEDYWWKVISGASDPTLEEYYEGVSGCGQHSVWSYDGLSDGDPTGNILGIDAQYRYGSFGYWQYTQHILVYDDGTSPQIQITKQDTFCSLLDDGCNGLVTFEITISSVTLDDAYYEIYSTVGGRVTRGDLTTGNNFVSVNLDQGNYSISIVASDLCGEASTVAKNFTVLGANVLCEPTYTISLQNGCGVTLDPFLLASGNTDRLDSLIILDDIPQNGPIADGIGVYDYALFDTSGILLCTGEIETIDEEGPIVSCQNQEVYLDLSGQAQLKPDKVMTSTDNCSDVVFDFLSKSSFSGSDLGVNQVIGRSYDGEFNFGTCVFQVVVKDLIPPTVFCAPRPVMLDEYGEAFVPSDYFDVGSYDNTGTLSWSLSQSYFTRVDTGLQTIEIVVSDLAGNTTTCTIDIVVEAPECSPVLSFTDGTVPGGIQQAVGLVEASVPLESTSHTVLAGEEIRLLPGFATGVGSSFSAVPVPCVQNERSVSYLSIIEPNQDNAEKGKISIRIIPNPVVENAAVKINLAQSSSVALSIFSTQGKLIQTLYEAVELPRGIHTINWSSTSLSPGLYFVRLKTDKEADVEAFVVQ